MADYFGAVVGARPQLRLIGFGIAMFASVAFSRASDREWVVLSTLGGVKVIEAVAIEEAGPAVLITDVAGKKGGYNVSAIRERLPAPPEDRGKVGRDDATSAIQKIDGALARFPTIKAALGAARADWERCVAAMDAEEASRREEGRRADAYLAQRADSRTKPLPSAVESHIRLGEELIVKLPERASEIQAHLAEWRALLAPPKTEARAIPERRPIPEAAMRLANDARFRVNGTAAPGGTIAWIVGTIGVSMICFMFCAMRGLERLLRAPASALAYLGCATGGFVFYVFLGARIFEAPPDYLALTAADQGEPIFVEKVVALSQHRADIDGDAGGLESVSLHDGGVNRFLADRLEYVAGPAHSPLEPLRRSVSVDVRDDAVLFYEEVDLLGVRLLVTLVAPIEGQMNALRFGEPAGRVGTLTVLPRSLVSGLWNSLRGAMSAALDDVGVPATFNVERVSGGAIHLVLRPNGAIGDHQGRALARREKANKTFNMRR